MFFLACYTIFYVILHKLYIILTNLNHVTIPIFHFSKWTLFEILLLAIFGQFESFGTNSNMFGTSNWEILDHFWPIMASFVRFWSLGCNFDQFWGHFDSCWPRLFLDFTFFFLFEIDIISLFDRIFLFNSLFDTVVIAEHTLAKNQLTCQNISWEILVYFWCVNNRCLFQSLEVFLDMSVALPK